MKTSSLLLVIMFPFLSHAQNSGPKAEPIIDRIPSARDIPWPGIITLAVDAFDVTRGVFRTSETIPVAGAGPMFM